MVFFVAIAGNNRAPLTGQQLQGLCYNSVVIVTVVPPPSTPPSTPLLQPLLRRCVNLKNCNKLLVSGWGGFFWLLWCQRCHDLAFFVNTNHRKNVVLVNYDFVFIVLRLALSGSVSIYGYLLGIASPSTIARDHCFWQLWMRSSKEAWDGVGVPSFTRPIIRAHIQLENYGQNKKCLIKSSIFRLDRLNNDQRAQKNYRARLKTDFTSSSRYIATVFWPIYL